MYTTPRWNEPNSSSKDSLGKTTYLYQTAWGFESPPEHDKILSTLYKSSTWNVEGFLFDTRDSEPL